MLSLAERLAAAVALLAPVSDSPRLDAELLLAHALRISPKQLSARLKTSPEVPEFDAFVERRIAYEPIPYILGEWEFFSLELEIEEPILVPRAETEHLVEAVLEHIGQSPARVLELGTGSGCVSLAVAVNAPQCQVIATDINEAALALAARNIKRHALESRVALFHGDLFAALPDGSEPFDAICSNPPYVEESAWPDLSPSIRMYEDPRALLAGQDGLDVVRRILKEAPAHIRPDGLLALEIGMGQYDAVHALLCEHGYVGVGYRNDLAGIPRIAVGHVPKP
ncbi:MAG: peptide chain release factor N(5)-glutamine methyltransferase [Candidatus Hydrogenedentes bacterium]|nr:peptide chain release factor N(5)-glutamine methyltransferase [Candidatus Hydrogenedentota bacterium]